MPLSDLVPGTNLLVVSKRQHLPQERLSLNSLLEQTPIEIWIDYNGAPIFHLIRNFPSFLAHTAVYVTILNGPSHDRLAEAERLIAAAPLQMPLHLKQNHPSSSYDASFVLSLESLSREFTGYTPVPPGAVDVLGKIALNKATFNVLGQSIQLPHNCQTFQMICRVRRATTIGATYFITPRVVCFDSDFGFNIADTDLRVDFSGLSCLILTELLNRHMPHIGPFTNYARRDGLLVELH
jgi:hypothetical protein